MMTNEQFEDLLDQIARLQAELWEMKEMHRMLMHTMHSDHAIRMRLLSEVIADNKDRNKCLDKFFRDEADWWKQ